MTVERLRDTDRDAAVELWRAAGLTRPWNDPVADLDRALAGPSSTVLAVRDDGLLTGTVMVGHDGHRGWVYYLAVATTHRRHGLGRGLMAGAEAWLSQRVPKCQLMVRRENAEAVGFYAALGYETSDVVVLQRWIGG